MHLKGDLHVSGYTSGMKTIIFRGENVQVFFITSKLFQAWCLLYKYDRCEKSIRTGAFVVKDCTIRKSGIDQGRPWNRSRHIGVMVGIG